LLSATGGVLGVVLARWGVALLVWLSPAELPRSAEVQLDDGVLWCAGGAALLSSLFLGLFPALQGSPRNLRDSLRGVGRAVTSGRSRTRVRSALVIAEVALSLVLLTGAGLTLKSFRKMVDLDPGFQPQGLYTMRLALPGTRYRTPESIASFHDALHARIQALPGLTETGAISIPP